jgi:hemerythrin-like domain-containing protein
MEVNKKYRNKEKDSLNDIIILLKKMIKKYPEHVKKESNVFFPATLNYFSEEEHQEIIAEFWEFDRTLIHQKYQDVVREIEAKNRIHE